MPKRHWLISTPINHQNFKKNGDNLVTTYSDDDIYCSLAQTGFYEEKSFRNFDYYATFTDKQYDSLSALLKGIVSHVNYRAAGKTDIGPAFDWDRVIKGVKA